MSCRKEDQVTVMLKPAALALCCVMSCGVGVGFDRQRVG